MGNDNVKVTEAGKTNFPPSTFFFSLFFWSDLRMSVMVCLDRTYFAKTEN